ncbi:hypothetical protein OGAPHI_004407 [Ogataea philodendri]|uniref:Protein SST2 n=1 Tax=Ogataea philodendri TaxID=1378263 RepID=A0A9P8P5J9_9ASCO|nr:uncharacterized protein OGAPHI_004407 [Ogataea philodendri]KAH3666218.1 hypothetical protein OGAPHI_004407 [Ogataea philodendri]
MTEPAKKLQGVVNKSFNTIPCHEISVKDLKDIYSCLLYCLDLKHEPDKDHKLLKLSFKTNHPYSFSLDKALATMQKLQIHIENPATRINISYEIKAKAASDLLQMFMNARLLHSPDDKTRSRLKHGVVLQPTPKGVAVLGAFCSKYGLRGTKQIPEILKSNINSMELICFERNSRSDSIIHSEYWNKVLFVHLMGPVMNFWSPNVPPDELPDLAKIYEEERFGNAFEGFDMTSQSSFLAFLSEKQAKPHAPVSDNPIIETVEKNPVSPFHHRFFTNPDSDSHVQYYVSSRGVRMFRNKVLEKPDGMKKVVGNCFSGKAMVQWLLDCTDVFSQEEAVRMAGLFLNLGLIRLLDPEDPAAKPRFSPKRDSFYFLTDEGMELVQWNHTVKSGNSSDEDSDSGSSTTKPDHRGSGLTLQDVLNDPGIKYQFRTHLVDEFSVENLEVYNDISMLEKKFKTLKKLLKLKEREKQFMMLTPTRSKRKATISAAVIKLSTDCLGETFNIYTSYLAEGAPFELNLNSRLKHEISCIMTQTEAYTPRPAKTTVSELSVPTKLTPDPSTGKKDPSKLTLDLQNLKLVDPPAPSPTDRSIAPILEALAEIMPLFQQVKKHTFGMMAKDSLPKFMESELFKELPVSK